MSIEWAIEELRRLAIFNHQLRTLLARQNQALYLVAKERDALLAYKRAKEKEDGQL